MDYQIYYNIRKQPPKVFCKKLFLKISQYSEEKPVWSVFLLKLQAFTSQRIKLLKRDPGTGVFLQILRNF